MNDLIAQFTHHLFGTVSEPVGHGLVDFDYAVLVVHDHDPGGKGIKGPLLFFFGLDKLFLGPLALGDVLGHPQKSPNGAIRVPEYTCSGFG